MATEKDYLAVQQSLLPPGQAWPRDGESLLTRVLTALADGWNRLHARALRLVEEADPRTAREMIMDWETVCGLPDECTFSATTLEERREAVVRKLTYRGGQSRTYFQGLAKALGYEIEILEFRPFVCGLARVGDVLTAGHEVRHVWRVWVKGVRATRFRCGVSSCPDKLGKIDYAEDLECLLTRWKPAHTRLVFGYNYGPDPLVDFFRCGVNCCPDRLGKLIMEE